MLYTVPEAVEYLGHKMSEKMIRYYLRNRTLKGKFTGKVWIIEKRELDKFIKNLGR